MIISRAEKRTKVPKREKISELAKHKATMIFYLSIHLLSDIVKEALAGGYSKSTPVGVVTPVASANDGYNTITFNAKGQSATLLWVNSAWMILALGSTSALLAAGTGPITA